MDLPVNISGSDERLTKFWIILKINDFICKVSYFSVNFTSFTIDVAGY